MIPAPAEAAKSIRSAAVKNKVYGQRRAYSQGGRALLYTGKGGLVYENA